MSENDHLNSIFALANVHMENIVSSNCEMCKNVPFSNMIEETSDI